MNYIGTEPAPAGLVLVGDTNPVGAISLFHAPPDASWLRLNGQAVAKATYPDLWAWAQGFLTADQVANPGLYRNVDANTFAVPKLDGLFLRALGQFDVNRASGVLGARQDDDFKSHTHYNATTNTPPNSISIGGGASTYLTGGPSGATGGVETRPTNVALQPCVKALRTVLIPGTAVPAPVAGPGQLIQSRSHVRGDLFAPAAVVIPLDDTIPQITEGNEFFSVANFAPTMIGSRIKINAVANCTQGVASLTVAALFRADSVNALAVVSYAPTGADYEHQLVLGHEIIAASLVPITFSVRVGPTGAGATIRLNGRAARLFGGAYNSFLRIDEYSA
jgi:hypothetical protein